MEKASDIAQTLKFEILNNYLSSLFDMLEVEPDNQPEMLAIPARVDPGRISGNPNWKSKESHDLIISAMSLNMDGDEVFKATLNPYTRLIELHKANGYTRSASAAQDHLKIKFEIIRSVSSQYSLDNTDEPDLQAPEVLDEKCLGDPPWKEYCESLFEYVTSSEPKTRTTWGFVSAHWDKTGFTTLRTFIRKLDLKKNASATKAKQACKVIKLLNIMPCSIVYTV